MANNFFKSIKSAFVTEVPDDSAILDSNINTEPVSKKTESVSATPLTLVSSSVPIVGEVDEEILQTLCQMLEDSNLPGPDYLELKNLANNEEMRKAIPDELQRFKVSFITMKSTAMDLTKERVISSIDSYINKLEEERKVGHTQLDALWKEKVEIKKQSLAESEIRLQRLEQEFKELSQFIKSLNNEITTCSHECDTKRANFNRTVDFIVSNLREDKEKISKILN